MNDQLKTFAVFFALLLLAGCNNNKVENDDQDSADLTESEENVVVETAFPEHVYWGDQHLHTSWSGDAGAAGTVIGPEEALRFAMGEEVTNNSGQPAKLHRPLDWLCVSDHSDGMGVISFIKDGDPELMKIPLIKKWHDGMNSTDNAVQKAHKLIWCKHKAVEIYLNN